MQDQSEARQTRPMPDLSDVWMLCDLEAPPEENGAESTRSHQNSVGTTSLVSEASTMPPDCMCSEPLKHPASLDFGEIFALDDDGSMSATTMNRALELRAKAELWETHRDEVQTGAKISRGQVTNVFHARWRGLDCEAKILYSNADRGGDEYHAMLRDLKTVSHLRHPNIVLFLGACTQQTSDGQPLIILSEAMSGGSLEAYLSAKRKTYGRRWKPPVQKARDWMIDVARACTFLHGCSPPICHGNIDTCRLLLTEEGHLKLSDFVHGGRPRPAAPEGGKKERAGSPFRAHQTGAAQRPDEDWGGRPPSGHPPAVEGGEGEEPLGPQSAHCKGDVFQMGGVFFQLATGRHAARFQRGRLMSGLSGSPPGPHGDLCPAAKGTPTLGATCQLLGIDSSESSWNSGVFDASDGSGPAGSNMFAPCSSPSGSPLERSPGSPSGAMQRSPPGAVQRSPSGGRLGAGYFPSDQRELEVLVSLMLDRDPAIRPAAKDVLAALNALRPPVVRGGDRDRLRDIGGGWPASDSSRGSWDASWGSERRSKCAVM